MERNYAFEIPDVPTQSEYLEVRYSVSEYAHMHPIEAFLFVCLFTYQAVYFLFGVTGWVPCTTFRPQGGDFLSHFWNQHF